MATELAKAYVQIIPSASGIKGKIENELSGEAASAGKASGVVLGNNLVSSIKKAIKAAGIGLFLKEAITEGADLEQSIGGIETLFKDSADKVIARAQTAYKTAGLSANEYMENITSFSASLLQGLSGDTNKAADIADMAMTDMADNANKMGSSMESIQNAYQGFAKQNYTMLDNLKLGYGGTKTEMERLLAHAQELTGIEYNIDNLSDVYSAINVIQKELKISGLTAEEAAEAIASGAMTEEEAFEAMGTTAKEAATTVSGSFASMKAAFKTFLGNLAIGEDITNSLRAMIETASTFLFANLIPMVANIVIGIAKTLVTTDWTGYIRLTVYNMQTAFKTCAQKAFGTDTNLVQFIIEGINTKLPELLQTGVEMVSNLLNGILSAIPDVLGYIGEVSAQIIQCFLQNAPLLIEAGIQLVSNIISGITEYLPQVVETALEVKHMLMDTIAENSVLLIEAGMGLVSNLISGIIEYLPQIVETVLEVVNTLLSTIIETAPTLIDGGIELIVDVAKGILDSLPQIVESAFETVQTFLDKVMEGAPGLIDGGVELVKQAADGVIRNIPEIISAAIECVGEMLATILENAPQLVASGLELIAQVIVGIIQAVPDLLLEIPEIAKQIIEGFAETDWLSIGSNIIDGIVEGVSSAAGSLVDSVVGAAQSALSGVKELLGIHSPSRVFENEVGKMIVAGITNGIGDGENSVERTMKQLGKTAVKAYDIELDSQVSTISNQKIDLYELGDYIIQSMTEQGKRQADALEKGIGNLKIVLNERELNRYIANAGFSRG